MAIEAHKLEILALANVGRMGVVEPDEVRLFAGFVDLHLHLHYFAVGILFHECLAYRVGGVGEHVFVLVDLDDLHVIVGHQLGGRRPRLWRSDPWYGGTCLTCVAEGGAFLCTAGEHAD
ncbi:MAG: hypothetical protein AAGD32_04200 [Planctomycetota bacterium]